MNVIRQSTCLVFNQITADFYASLFNLTPVGRASDYDARLEAIHLSWLRPELDCPMLGPPELN